MKKFLHLLVLFCLCVVTAQAATTYKWEVKTNFATSKSALENDGWTITTSNGTYTGYDGTKGMQFGSGNQPEKTLTLSSTSSSIFSGKKITKVTINTSGASSVSATVSVSVNGTSYGSKSITDAATDYNFTGNATGNVEIKYNQTSSKALYLKSIIIDYEDGSTLNTFDPNFEKKYTLKVGETKDLGITSEAPGISYVYGGDGVITIINDKITANKPGSVTVTATWPAEKGYDKGSASFEVSVIDDSQGGGDTGEEGEGELSSYTILFKTASSNNSSSQFSTSSQPSAVLEDGSDYVKAFTAVTLSYPEGIGGARIGQNSNDGKLSFDLTEKGQVVPTKIVCLISANKASTKMKINGNEYTVSSAYSNENYVPCELPVSNDILKSFTIEKTGSNIGYIRSITVYYKTSTGGGSDSTPKDLEKFEYSAKSVTWDLKEGASNPALPTLEIEPSDANLEITYTSSDENVARVDNDGTVTPKAVGETTITANFAGNDDYRAKTASFTLTVKNTSQGDVTETTELKESFGDNGQDINNAEHFDPLLPSGNTYFDEVKTSKSLTTGITYAVKRGIITQQSNSFYLQLQANQSELSFTTPSNCKEMIFTLGVGSAKTVTANISEDDSDAVNVNFDTSSASPNVYTITKPGKKISIQPTTTLKIAALTFVLDGEAKSSCDEPKFILNNESTLENGSYLYGDDKIYLTTDTEGADIYYTINGGEKTKFDSESPITFAKNDDYVIAAWSSMEDGSYADSGQVTYTIHYRKVNPQVKYTAILITDFSEFEPGNQYLIVGKNATNNSYNVLTNDCVNAFNVVGNAEVNEEGSQVLFTENMSKVTFEKDEEGDFWNMLLDNGDYIATNYSNTNNYVTTSSEINAKTKVTISMNEDNTFNIAFKEGGFFKYNPTSPRFSCYSEKSQNSPYLYRLYIKDDPIVAKATWSLDSEETDTQFDFETSHANKVTLLMTLDCEDDDIESYTIRLGDHRWTIEPDEEGNATLEIPYIEYALTKEPILVRGMIRGERTTYYNVELDEFTSAFEQDDFNKKGHTHWITDNYSYGVYNWNEKAKTAQVALNVYYEFELNGHKNAHYVVTSYELDNDEATVEYNYLNNQATIRDFTSIPLENVSEFVDALKKAELPKIKASTIISYPVIYLAEPEVIMILKEDTLNKRIMKVERESTEYLTKVYKSEYTDEVNAPTPMDDVITSTDEMAIDSSVCGEVVYFNLQGQKVNKPEKGVYIIVKDGKAEKVVL